MLARGDVDASQLMRGIKIGANNGAPTKRDCHCRKGTLGFRSPELLSAQGPDSYNVDVWSAGVIMACIMSKRYPLFDLTRKSTDEDAWVEIVRLLGYRSGMKFPSTMSVSKQKKIMAVESSTSLKVAINM